MFLFHASFLVAFFARNFNHFFRTNTPNKTNMKRTALILLLLLWPEIVSPAELSGEALLKSIGLGKPARSRVPDFNLRDSTEPWPV